jgi:DNA modification methylase
MVLDLVCGCLLLSILIPVAVLAEHWVEDAGHRFVDRMIWREPVESWNQ